MYTSLLLAVPLLVGNLWHAIMPLVGRKRTDFKNSISENALRSKSVLLTHRLVHVGLSVCFFFYAAYLFNQGLIAASVLLVCAALCDSIQVVTLSRRTNHTPMYFRDIHQVSAWTMAIAYLVFSIVFAINLGVIGAIFWTYIAWLACIFIVLFYAKHRLFWFVQMAFFVSVSTMMGGLAVFYN